MFTSQLYNNEPVYDDFFFPKAEDVLIGGELKTRGMIPRDYERVPLGSMPFAERLTLPLVPRDEWKERIEEMERTQSRLSDIILDTYTTNNPLTSLDQNGTNYCWINGPVTGVETIRLVSNQVQLRLSPASAGARIKNFRNYGGWGTEALEWLVEHGVNTIDEWPANAISRKYNTVANQESAKRNRVLEWYDIKPRSLDELMTCLFYRIPVAVGYNWWRHEVCAMDPVFINNSFAIRIRNSWGDRYGNKGFAVLSGNKAIPDDAVAPRVASLTDI